MHSQRLMPQDHVLGLQEPGPNQLGQEGRGPVVEGVQGIVVAEDAVAALDDEEEPDGHDHHPGLKENWVFPTEDGGMRLPQSAVKVYDLAREAAHLDQRVGPQVLRRSMNTALLRAGVDRITLRAMMGHTSETMTERYAGIDIDLKRAAVQRIFPHIKKPQM